MTREEPIAHRGLLFGLLYQLALVKRCSNHGGLWFIAKPKWYSCQDCKRKVWIRSTGWIPSHYYR